MYLGLVDWEDFFFLLCFFFNLIGLIITHVYGNMVGLFSTSKQHDDQIGVIGISVASNISHFLCVGNTCILFTGALEIHNEMLSAVVT